MAYLTDTLKELSNAGKQPILDFEFLGSSSFRARERKNGSPYNAGELLLKIRSTGKETKEMVFNQLYFDKLVKTLTPGCLVRATLNARGFVDWSLVPSGEAALDLPKNTNAQEVKTEREFSGSLDTQVIKNNCITLQAVVKSMLEAGRTVEEVKEQAPDLVRWINATAIELSSDSL